MPNQNKNSELVEKILSLKEKRKAVILTHNYQRPEVQDIGDFVGDSLELSRKAAEVNAPVIVFCGVHFMAETASILSPDSVVLLPDVESGCPMADMITVEQLIAKKKELPGVRVVCYVNSSAAVKAESDICCTSANAVNVVRSMGESKILFIPDQYLGYYVTTRLRRDMYLWPGFCPTHVKIQAQDIIDQKKRYPGAVALAHPECRPEVTAVADEVLSTGGMLRYARTAQAEVMIIATETGILHRLKKENFGKTFVPATAKAVCPNMKRITLEKVLWALEEMKTEVKVPIDVRKRAISAVDRMLSL
ncbi:MAG: quinolinate synthase NadA [Dehalococcoidia bacterium]|nr:quinolinate synthase NadA [Dehalococcoidia bacterium]